MPSARFGFAYPPAGHHSHAGAPYSPYRGLGGGGPMEHPSVTHRRMVEHMRAGAHPAVAAHRARARSPVRSMTPAGNQPQASLQQRAEALARQFQNLYGAHARIEISERNEGPVAEAFQNLDGSTTIRVDPGIPDYALPSVIGHEMGHALQATRGAMGMGPNVEREATRIAGDFLRRSGHPIHDGLRFLRETGGDSVIHGSLQGQLNALVRGYYNHG